MTFLVGISPATRYTGLLDNNKKSQPLEGIGFVVIKCVSLVIFLEARNITPFWDEVKRVIDILYVWSRQV
jgi:hypothetical protein